VDFAGLGVVGLEDERGDGIGSGIEDLGLRIFELESGTGLEVEDACEVDDC